MLEVWAQLSWILMSGFWKALIIMSASCILSGVQSSLPGSSMVVGRIPLLALVGLKSLLLHWLSAWSVVLLRVPLTTWRLTSLRLVKFPHSQPRWSPIWCKVITRVTYHCCHKTYPTHGSDILPLFQISLTGVHQCPPVLKGRGLHKRGTPQKPP